MSSASAPKRRYGGKTADERREDRRRRLLDAALELFGTGGYAAGSVEQICDLASLSTRQFYEEFSNRDEALISLYDEINAGAMEAVSAVVLRELAAGSDARAMLERALSCYISSVAADPHRAHVAFNVVVGVNATVEEHRLTLRRGWIEQLAELIAAAALEGLFDVRPRQELRLQLTAFIGAVNGLIHDWSLDPESATADEVAHTLAHMLYSTLTAVSRVA